MKGPVVVPDDKIEFCHEKLGGGAEGKAPVLSGGLLVGEAPTLNWCELSV
jgi:hypothetical protein